MKNMKEALQILLTDLSLALRMSDRYVSTY